MANIFAVLFRGAASIGSTTLYTAGTGVTTSILSIVVTNTTTATQTYSMSIDGVSIATDVPVSGNASIIVEPKQVVEESGTISGMASNTGVNFHISGLEVTA